MLSKQADEHSVAIFCQLSAGFRRADPVLLEPRPAPGRPKPCAGRIAGFPDCAWL